MKRVTTIIVDADACPVKDEIQRVSHDYHVDVLFVASYAAYMHDQPQLDRVKWVFVDQDYQAADMYIANHARSEDIIVTNDYGLAALCLPRGAKVLTPRGKELDASNLDDLLTSRHVAAKARRAGQKTKGPKPMTDDDRKFFQHKLTKLLLRLQENHAT
ncbi:YaiI/YqxD family protein [Paenibacillus sp. 1001270B_150601_E10]|uniref:YaiI/YqxD family protein n=1 Tax=Paenibacillus sp. 1001270B_150601_E10 TaxID=2787079 RepID=UPI0018A09CDC|nr:YaiI/YqxD family protein [Paenibacillus sp. 1001270B_150601_E10]